MVGIQGLGGVEGPRPDRPAGARDRKDNTSPSTESGKDGVIISTAAQAAVAIANTVQASDGQPDIRAERVAEAREALERGDHKDPDVVAVVVDRISKFL